MTDMDFEFEDDFHGAMTLEEDVFGGEQNMNWKGDTAASARAISNAQARFRDKQHKQTSTEGRKTGMVPAGDYKEAARKRGAQRTASSWFKLKEGDNSFRILPTPEGAKSQPVWTEYALHREVGPKKVTVRCGKNPLNDGKGNCYICDTLIPKLEAKGHDSRAEALRAKDVFLVQVAKVVYLQNEEVEFSGPYLFTPAKGVADQILSSIIGSKKRTYEDPRKGFNLTLNRQGTGRNDTRYGMIEPDDAPTEVTSAIIKKLKPFDELKEIPKYSEAAQRAAYSGVDAVPDEEDEDIEDPEHSAVDADDEDEAPPPRKKKVAPVEDDEDEPEPPRKKKAAPVDDDDDEPEPPKKKKAVAVDDDEDEAPAPRKKSAPDDDDDFDMSDLDDLDEEDEAPKKKKPVAEDDEEEPAPAKKKKPAPVDDDEDEPAPPKKKKAAPVDDDDEPEPPKKKKAAPVDDDDDEPPAKRKLPPKRGR